MLGIFPALPAEYRRRSLPRAQKQGRCMRLTSLNFNHSKKEVEERNKQTNENLKFLFLLLFFLTPNKYKGHVKKESLDLSVSEILPCGKCHISL